MEKFYFLPLVQLEAIFQISKTIDT